MITSTDATLWDPPATHATDVSAGKASARIDERTMIKSIHSGRLTESECC